MLVRREPLKATRNDRQGRTGVLSVTLLVRAVSTSDMVGGVIRSALKIV